MSTPTHARAQAAARDTDEDLVHRLGGGDEDALRALHLRYAPLVFTVAARIVDAATAEDVVQEVFVTLWERHATFDPARGTFKSWILQIARNRALNELRRKRGHAQPGDEAITEVPDESLQPDESQWLARRQVAVRAAVDALPAAQRQALGLAFFGELTHEQISSLLRTPVGTTKTRIRSALRRLAPVLVAMLVVAAILVLKRPDEHDARDRRALRMITASDVVPLALRPAIGVPAEVHGSYRSRIGADVAVLTTSHLPAPPPGEIYLAWAHHAYGWRLLGRVQVEADGRSLLVSETGSHPDAPDEVRVTRESNAAVVTPTGVAVLVGSASDAPTPPR